MTIDTIGRGWAFPPHLDERGQFALVGGEENIRQSILIILNTAPGERVMRPDFGCRIHDLVFAPASPATAAMVERHVAEALARWEPRIEVKSVTATPGESHIGQMIIEIVYEIRETHEPRSLVYPFYLIPDYEEAP